MKIIQILLIVSALIIPQVSPSALFGGCNDDLRDIGELNASGTWRLQSKGFPAWYWGRRLTGPNGRVYEDGERYSISITWTTGEIGPGRYGPVKLVTVYERGVRGYILRLEFYKRWQGP